MSTKYKYRSKADTTHSYALLPLAILLLILPVISYFHSYDPELSEYFWFTNETTINDMFLHCKSVVFILLSAIMLAQVIYRTVKSGRPAGVKIFLPLAVYAVLAFLSCLFSAHKDYAFGGGYEQFESIWVLLGYCITAYYAFLMVEEEKDIRFLMRFFVVGVLLSTLIGLSQATGHNFWLTSFGHALRFPSSIRKQVEISLAFEDTRVYMSLYNPNYVGLYAALIIPILLMLAFSKKAAFPKKASSPEKESFSNHVSSSEETQEKKSLPPAVRTGFILLLTAALGYCLLKSGAKNGFLALGIALAFLVLFLLLRYQKKWYLSIIALAALAALFFASDYFLGHQITNALKNMVAGDKAAYALQEISFDGDNVTITYQGKTVTLCLSEDNLFSFQDTDGNPLTFEQIPFPVSVSLLDDSLVAIATIDENEWYFYNNGEQTVAMGPFGKWGTFQTAPAAVFTRHESLFSNRGYIWSRTIPLLKDHLLLGSGADTFVFEFPNDDFVGKFNNGFGRQIVTKPHSMYLQVSVQTGLLSMIALLVFYLWYFFSCCRIYFTRQLDSYAARVGLGIFIGSIGYMASSLVNDSTITVAPVFWAMIGMGICINTKLIKVSETGK